MAARVPRPVSLRGRVLLVVLTLSGLLVLASVGAVVGQVREDTATARVTQQAMPALAAVERLERAFVDEQTGIRGYVLTGQDQVLDPYRQAEGLVAEQESLLRTTLSDEPAVIERLDAVLRAHRAWLEVAEPAVDLRAEGRQAELDQLVAASPGVPLFATLRAETAELREAIERRVDREVASATAVRSAVTGVLLGAAVLGLGCVLLAVAGIRRLVSRPLAELVGAVERVAGGDLDRPVPATGPPEFAAVGGAVDRMRLMLNEQRRTAVRVAELQESDRVATELGDGVVRRLFGVGTALTALAGRHPALSGELGRSIDELDRAIGEVRSAATGAPGPVPEPQPSTAARLADVLARVPRLLSVHPDVRMDAAADGMPPETADRLVGVLDRALDGLVETRARLDGMEVELAGGAADIGLTLSVRGVLPGQWVADVRAGARGWPGACRVVDLDPELTAVEWTLPRNR